jgi:hypothetical protein
MTETLAEDGLGKINNNLVTQVGLMYVSFTLVKVKLIHKTKRNWGYMY